MVSSLNERASFFCPEFKAQLLQIRYEPVGMKGGFIQPL